jgi:hypothetical protein
LWTTAVNRVNFEVPPWDEVGVMCNMLDQFLQYQRDDLANVQVSQIRRPKPATRGAGWA